MSLELGNLNGRYICSLQLLMKSVRVRNGMALLEPSNVQLKGWQNEDMQANQDQEFVRNLRRRMGFVPNPPSQAIYLTCFPASRKSEVDPNEEHQTQAAKSPTRAVTPPPPARQPHLAPPRPPAQPSLSAAPEPRRETRQLATSPQFTRHAPPAVTPPQLSPSPPRRKNLPTSGEDEGYSEGQSFGGMDVDDDFWGELDQIEDAERTGGSGRPSASTSAQGSRTITVVSDHSSGAKGEVITLDDDESGDESDEQGDWILGNGGNTISVRRVTPPPVPSSQPRLRPERLTQVQEVIDLSD